MAVAVALTLANWQGRGGGRGGRVIRAPASDHCLLCTGFKGRVVEMDGVILVIDIIRGHYAQRQSGWWECSDGWRLVSRKS